MVFLTFDWKSFRCYAENCRYGTYQIRETPEGIEVRVRAGRLGFKHHFVGAIEESNPKFAEEKDRLFYNEIAEFCKLQGFTCVVGSVPDEMFHA